MAKLYVAYGSNLNMSQMKDRCPTAEFVGTGIIQNYELQFKGSLHPHAELHHIKKENIGLIEVMGLAVLPSRLKAELAALEEAILTGADIGADPVLSKHAPWVEELKTRHTFTAENSASILQEEVGQVFRQVLEHAGVYKRTEAGREAFLRFVDMVNQEA